MFQIILSEQAKKQASRKEDSLLAALTDEGFKRPGIVQLRGRRKLPPPESNLTPLRPADSDVLNLTIAGLSRKNIFTTP